MKADLFLDDCRVVKPDGIVECGLAVIGGTIAAVVWPGERVEARRRVDVGGRYVLPGLVDTHLHLGNAAQPFAADCRTESRHAVTGGVTTLCPFVVTRGAYADVLPDWTRAVSEQSLVDMLFHAIVVDEAQIAEVPRLSAEFGVRSFKAFMAYKGREISPSGIRGMDDGQIFELLRRVAGIRDGIAIVHCENMELIELHQRPLRAAGRQDTAAWSDARPAFGELEAIRRMIALADAAGITLLVPHMSVGRGSEFLRQKRWGGARVLTETCPHYLTLDRDVDRGVAGKVNPPLRARDELDALWARLVDGTVDVLGSDHCPYTRASKGSELWSARAGITGGSAMILPVLLTEGVHQGRLSLERVVELTSYTAARLLGLYPRKGALEPGSDADLVVVDLDREVKVDVAGLNSVADFSPYEGYRARGWPLLTVAGGELVYENGTIVADRPRGRFIRR